MSSIFALGSYSAMTTTWLEARACWIAAGSRSPEAADAVLRAVGLRGVTREVADGVRAAGAGAVVTGPGAVSLEL